MKPKALIRELVQKDCVLKRSGGRHDVYLNPQTQRSAPVPRHVEVPDSLCKLIKQQLGIR